MTALLPEVDQGAQWTPEQLAARDRVYAKPLEDLDPGNPAPFQADEWHWQFERLRHEDPVHFTPADKTDRGAYWSLTKWDDIVAADTSPDLFSAEAGIVLTPEEREGDMTSAFDDGSMSEQEKKELEEKGGFRSLLSMDSPDHEIHRGAVQEVVSPSNLALYEPMIRERAGKILDSLPVGEPFDWVDLVSKDLTAMMLATLFDYPQEKRRQLTFWSDVMVSAPGPGEVVETIEEREAASKEFFETIGGLYFNRLENASGEPKIDFISLMAHNPHAKEFTPAELFGDLVVFLVGGNDTTRNTISGSVYALNKWPDQFAKLKADRSLLPNMISETIRWQTPLTHMMRKATRDVEFAGKQMRAGDRVALWYVSGNRDEDKLENPDQFRIDRKNPRQHLSFGFGIHRCLGNRLAELQLKVVWEEIFNRFDDVKVVEEPHLSFNNFAKGYEEMKVVLTPKK